MNPALHHNGHICPACELRREEANRKFTGPADVPCNNCGGTGRVSLDADSVCRRASAWAVKHYWPEREARWRLQNAPKSANG